jgi:outer membrane protein OmpA-like peptidoglycan-associated protein
MAELNVEPKQNKPWWLWLLLGLIAVLALIFLLRGCDDDRDMETDGTTTATTAGATTDRRTTGEGDWNNINRNVPVATYQEITDRDVTVRGNEDYAIYTMDEAILFDTDSDQLRPGADQKLQQVAQSLNQRYANGQVRIYGYTDARGSADYNEQLAEERAESVRNWLTQQGNISNDRISLHPVGEADPAATNETAQGRQQNRRVEIVARRAN